MNDPDLSITGVTKRKGDGFLRVKHHFFDSEDAHELSFGRFFEVYEWSGVVLSPPFPSRSKVVA